MRAELKYPYDELTSPGGTEETQKAIDAGLTAMDDTKADSGSVVACLNLNHLGYWSLRSSLPLRWLRHTSKLVSAFLGVLSGTLP